MQKHRVPFRRLKANRAYTVERAAAEYGVHKNTVRNWIRNDGLRPIDDRRPVLLKGAILNQFQAEKRSKAKRPCRPGEMYCLPCRKVLRPYGGMVDIIIVTTERRKIRALCPVCERPMYQAISEGRLSHFRTLYDCRETMA
jgi:hypothetical protein